MKSYSFLPLIFLKFWYYESPRAMIGYFVSLNKAFMQLFSLPLFLKTFFKPLKNEYRQGLVRFSRTMGMGIKAILIFVDVILLLILLASELFIFVGFLIFPIATIFLLIK